MYFHSTDIRWCFSTSLNLSWKKPWKTIRRNLERQAKKGALPEAIAEDILGRIKTTQDMADLAGVDFAIEAVTEHEPLKLDIFRKLDGIVGVDAILASNTSSIPITKIASVTRRPDKVIGMHFMNPVPVMKLVEVIRGHATSDETFTLTGELVAKLEKETAVSQDYPGFIVNRVLMPMINEAIFALYEGIATAEDIDKGMKLGTNQPMGPLALADLIGLDTVLAINQRPLRRFQGSQISSLPAAGKDGQCRQSRPQVRPRLFCLLRRTTWNTNICCMKPTTASPP